MNDYISKEMKRYNHLCSEIDGAYHEMSVKLGLSDSAMVILYTICDAGDSCLLQEICLRSGISKQTINSSIRKLEAEGILYLEAAGAKNKNVCFTEKGKALAKQTALRMMEAENEIFAEWPKEDVEQYLALTERYLRAIQKKAKEI